MNLLKPRVDHATYSFLSLSGAALLSQKSISLGFAFFTIVIGVPLMKPMVSSSLRFLKKLELSLMNISSSLIKRTSPATRDQLQRMVRKIFPKSLVLELERFAVRVSASSPSISGAQRLFFAGYEKAALQMLTELYERNQAISNLVPIARYGLNFSRNEYTEFVAQSLQLTSSFAATKTGLSDSDLSLLLECLSKHEPGKVKGFLDELGALRGKHIDLALVSYNHKVRFAQTKKAQAPGELLKDINDALQTHGLQPIKFQGKKFTWNSLSIPSSEPLILERFGDRVGVIVPAHNAVETLSVALNSLSNQTHRNLDVVIIDDGSTDRTFELAQETARMDNRFRAVRSQSNEGPYSSRNKALSYFKNCDFITTMDADDWSHPQKIEMQVSELQSDSNLVACVSGRINLNQNLEAFPKEGLRSFLGFNISSLMVKSGVIERLGGWLELPFAPDIEYLDRLRAVYGPAAMNYLELPLSLALSHPGQITRSVGSDGVRRLLGPRAEFSSLYKHVHGELPVEELHQHKISEKLQNLLPPEFLDSSFRQPEILELDVVLVSDFSYMGGTTTANVNEITVLTEKGLTVGLLHQPPAHRSGIPIRHVFHSLEHRCPSIRFLRTWHDVRAKVVTVHPLSTGFNSLVPTISSEVVKIIAHMAPFDFVNGLERYSPDEVEALARARFEGAEVTWWPVGPLVRSALEAFGSIRLSERDWLSPLKTTDLKPAEISPEQELPIRVGRVSRDDFKKWPKGKQKILEAYPPDDRFQIRVLGGIQDISERYRFKAPNRWEVLEFGSIDVPEFLEGIDVFVYAIHEDHLEEFGLVVLEALAAGIPVIASRSLEKTFGSACAYFDAEDEVPTLVMSVRDQPKIWAQKLAESKKYLQRHHPDEYLERLFS